MLNSTANNPLYAPVIVKLLSTNHKSIPTYRKHPPICDDQYQQECDEEQQATPYRMRDMQHRITNLRIPRQLQEHSHNHDGQAE